MKDIAFRKVLVVGIIALFVGASVAVPNIKMLTNVENIFSARAMETLDGVPFEPTVPLPGNNSENISTNPDISVLVIDPDNDTMNVSFYNAFDDSFIDDAEDVQNGTRAEVIWSYLEYNTTYSWYAIANDSIFENRSETWFFTTIMNHPPNEPIDPSPENNSENISINPDLSVLVTDPDNGTMNVSFYNASDDSHIGNVYNVPNGSRAEVEWSDLQYNTTYSWYVVADDGEYTNQSDVWNFTTTANHPPNEPSNPNPEDDATDVDIDADLSWTGGDPDGDDVTYDVYFGTTSSPPKVSSQTATSYDPGTLDYDRRYYWKIVSWDNQGASTEGPIWDFKTKALLPLEVTIIKPDERSFYLDGEKLFPLIMNTIVYGPIDIEVNATSGAEIDRVEFHINDVKKDTIYEANEDGVYTYHWTQPLCFVYTIKAIAYDDAGQNASAEIKVLKWRIHPLILLAGTVFIFRQLRSGTPFQWTILRGTVFNLKQVGNKYHGRAIRLHYTEIAPFSAVSGTGTIKLRKITFGRVPFMLTHDIGPVGITTYVFGIFPGKISGILA